MRAHQKIADAIINGKAIKIQEDYPELLRYKTKYEGIGCGSKYQRQNKN